MVKDIKTQVKILKEDTQELSKKVRDLTMQYKMPNCYLILNANYKILCLTIKNTAPVTTLVDELNTILRQYGHELTKLDVKIRTKINEIIQNEALNFVQMYYEYKDKQNNHFLTLDERLAQTHIELSSDNLQLRLKSNLLLSDFTLKAEATLTDVNLLLKTFQDLFTRFVVQMHIKESAISK